MRYRLTLTFGAVVMLAAAVGWFLLSSRIAHNDARTAAGESVGVALVLLLVASMVGSPAAVRANGSLRLLNG